MKVTVIILTYNEELHIDRCIRSAQLITDSICVVDSNSSDRTVDIASSLGAQVLSRKFDSHSRQFNWALTMIDPCDWVIRMDADEYLSEGLVNAINGVVESNCAAISGYAFSRRIVFLGKLIRFGGVFPVEIVRMFRYQCGKAEQRLMDEQIVVSGKVVALKSEIIDDNKNSLSWWIDKHNRYSSLEALETFSSGEANEARSELSGKTALRRKMKNAYYKLPISIRAVLLFIYRYLIRQGFRDGFYGFLFHFYQGLWYRLLVDSKHQTLVDAGIVSVSNSSVDLISHLLGLPPELIELKLDSKRNR